ncbi:MAG TPA: hypothetical protein VFA38_10170 [Nitrospirales bacterium]|nr:hypothetical protein [Nitrospirales bacterium]
MRLLLIICFTVVLFDLVGLIWSVADEKPHEAFVALTAPPIRSMQDPKHNSYFFMVGFAVPSTMQPLQTGYEMWLEADQADRYFDYAKDARVQAQLDRETIHTVSMWRMANLLNPAEPPYLQPAEQNDLLQSRYQQWLMMPFEDRGYGLRGSVRFAELFVAHRRYLASGNAGDLPGLIDRLERDLTAWRTILAEARTLPMKIIAAVVVEDDAIVLSELLKQPDLPKTAMVRLGTLARPLNYFEQSLRYPMQSEFVVGAHRYGSAQVDDPKLLEDDRANLRWLAAVARLNADAFQRVALRPPDSKIARAFLQKQRTLNIYAKYYDAAIKVSDTGDGPMPKLSVFVRSAPRSFFDYLMAPAFTSVDAVLGSGQEITWEPLMARMRETDARLRLAGLQVMLRAPGAQAVPMRLAQVGTALYDPFSGIPMLWNNEKSVLYSVGRDGLDDGGDTTLDVTVVNPLVQSEMPAVPAKSRRVAPTH